MLIACKIAFSKIYKIASTLVAMAVFIIIVSILRGGDWRVVVVKLSPLFVFVILAFLYLMIKEWSILKGVARLSRRQLFYRFYAAAAALFVLYLGLSFLWEAHGHKQEGFGMLFPIFLFCVGVCAAVLFHELKDLN